MKPTIDIGGAITLTNWPHHDKEKIKRTLQIQNPSYMQAIRTNPKARFALSEFFHYYEQTKTGALVVGRGLEGRVERYASQSFDDYVVNDSRVSRPAPITTTITLRPYQEGVPETAARHSQGIIQMDTGAGKSIVALKLAEHLGERTLIVVPNIRILEQFIYETKQHTNINDPGIIQGKHARVADITVATIQSLAKALDRGWVTPRSFGCVIVDECHKFITDRRRRTIQRFRPRCLYGLSATPRRSDGQDEAIKWTFGPVIVKRHIERATPVVKVVPFKEKIFVDEYAQMIDAQTENENRNALIVRLANEAIDDGRHVLILTKRVKHYEDLYERLLQTRPGHGDEIFTLSGGTKAKEQMETFRGLRQGTIPFQALLGTVSLLSTGVDIPRLDTLILAGDVKSDVLVQQGAGRVRRLLQGKRTPHIYDIHDVGNGILRRQGNLRRKFYAQMGWDVEMYVN